ncbi:hypothetical protein [Pseudomonas orientalis]|uniref:hypothetical protein n=1 Tax=Pseudomonas orientalis TaxID=76758 RepID=UPI001023160D|nr:hypothetical protein [Pseudomonas orientalis]RZI25112.1 hypothetical protein EUX53_09480 [Pseudomonas orientalis]
MKGRRKAKTDKWRMRDQFIREARTILASKTDAGQRFLRIAAQTEIEEPVGLLAGSRKAPEGIPTKKH